jgi:hypothetical protein
MGEMIVRCSTSPRHLTELSRHQHTNIIFLGKSKFQARLQIGSKWIQQARVIRGFLVWKVVSDTETIVFILVTNLEKSLKKLQHCSITSFAPFSISIYLCPFSISSLSLSLSLSYDYSLRR